MTPENFAYWLQGFVELNGEQPTPEQWQSIKEHLKTVFNKVTPPLLNGKEITYGWSEQIPTPLPYNPPTIEWKDVEN